MKRISRTTLWIMAATLFIVVINGICLSFLFGNFQDRELGVIRTASAAKLTEFAATSSEQLPTSIKTQADAVKAAQDYEKILLNGFVTGSLESASKDATGRWTVTMTPTKSTGTVYDSGYSFMMDQNGLLKAFFTVNLDNSVAADLNDTQTQVNAKGLTENIMKKLGRSGNYQTEIKGTTLNVQLFSANETLSFSYFKKDGDLHLFVMK